MSKDDIKRAVDKHLGPTRRRIVETVPASHGDAADDAPKAGAAPKKAAKAEAPKPAAPAKKPAGKAKKKRP